MLNPYADRDRAEARREDAEEAFEKFCEARDLDPFDPLTDVAYDAYIADAEAARY